MAHYRDWPELVKGLDKWGHNTTAGDEFAYFTKPGTRSPIWLVNGPLGRLQDANHMRLTGLILVRHGCPKTLHLPEGI